MSNPTPPPHLVCLADDDQLGFLVVAGLLLIAPAGARYMDLGNFFGLGELSQFIQLPLACIGIGVLIYGVNRLLRPGCRILLRINHGGLTDFRYNDVPLQWQQIQGVTSVPGFFGNLFSILLLQVENTALPPKNANRWYHILHYFLRKKNHNLMIILCASLDCPTTQIVSTIQNHLDYEKNKQKLI